MNLPIEMMPLVYCDFGYKLEMEGCIYHYVLGTRLIRTSWVFSNHKGRAEAYFYTFGKFGLTSGMAYCLN